MADLIRWPKVSQVKHALAARASSYPGLTTYAGTDPVVVVPCAFFQPIEWTHSTWLIKVTILLNQDREAAEDEIFNYLDPAGSFVSLLQTDVGDALAGLTVTVQSAKPQSFPFRDVVYHGGVLTVEVL